jgi:hypothetical protein
MPIGIYKRKSYSPEVLAIKREAIKKAHLFNKGRKLSEEHKKHLKENHVSCKGQKRTAEQKLKISLSLKGRVSPMKGKIMTAEHKRKIGLANANPSLETRIKKSNSARKGINSIFWKGGVTEVNKIIRQSYEYRLWRTAVFERDNYTCVWCGKRSQKGQSLEIQADHIKPFCDYPALRFAIDNGRTLCRECHKKTDTFGWNNYNKKNG